MVSPLPPRVVLEIIQRKNLRDPSGAEGRARNRSSVCVEQQDAAQSAGSAGTQDPALRRTALEQKTARRIGSWTSKKAPGEHGR